MTWSKQCLKRMFKLVQNTVILLLAIYPRVMNAFIREMSMNAPSSLFIVAPNWKELRCSPTAEAVCGTFYGGEPHSHEKEQPHETASESSQTSKRIRILMNLFIFNFLKFC